MTIPPEQAPVAAFLAGLAGRPAKETHISAVFVGRDTVWKLKKAVRLPFLDFSSLAAREHFLRRELALNQPTAPEIYSDVVAVSRQPGGTFTLGGAPAVDWVLRMARVPEGDFLDVIAARGGLTDALLDALGDAVVRDHALRPPVAGWDSHAALMRVTAGNADSALAAGLPPDAVRNWQGRMEAALAALRPWLTERAAAGRVRRCHGDLHLGNVCLWRGEPLPFDALEFDETLATTDTAYDLAFLLMDLDLRVGRAAANRVLNRVIARGGDAAAVRGLPAFLSERALIRAHVSAASAKPDAAAMYLAAARDYLVPKPAIILAIGGLQGTGKSTIARLLAPDLGRAPGAVVLRSDEIRKRLHGVAPEQRLPPAAYAEDVNATVNATLADVGQQVAAAGHAVILDATFLDARMRDAAAAAAARMSVPFLGVWLHAPLAELERRVAARRDDASDATLEVLRRSAAAASDPVGWLRVAATDRDSAVAAIGGAIATRLADDAGRR